MYQPFGDQTQQVRQRMEGYIAPPVMGSDCVRWMGPARLNINGQIYTPLRVMVLLSRFIPPGHSAYPCVKEKSCVNPQHARVMTRAQWLQSDVRPARTKMNRTYEIYFNQVQPDEYQFVRLFKRHSNPGMTFYWSEPTEAWRAVIRDDATLETFRDLVEDAGPRVTVVPLKGTPRLDEV